jgi:hypothetical protein
VFLEQPPLGTSRSKELKAKRTQKSLVARKVKGLNRIVKVSYDNLRFENLEIILLINVNFGEYKRGT